jgi:CBS domain-containing protein
VTTAADLMKREIVAVTPETEVPELLRILAAEQISGVPVVEDGGVVAGVVSATDVIRLAARLQEEAEGDTGLDPFLLPPEEMGDEDADFFLASTGEIMVGGTPERWQGRGVLDGYTVRDIMTEAAFSVSPQTPVKELAEFLLRGRIHRALVVENGQLRGMVTTFDLLRELVGGE